jgi:hypothetical protein
LGADGVTTTTESLHLRLVTHPKEQYNAWRVLKPGLDKVLIGPKVKYILIAYGWTDVKKCTVETVMDQLKALLDQIQYCFQTVYVIPPPPMFGGPPSTFVADDWRKLCRAMEEIDMPSVKILWELRDWNNPGSMIRLEKMYNSPPHPPYKVMIRKDGMLRKRRMADFVKIIRTGIPGGAAIQASKQAVQWEIDSASESENDEKEETGKITTMAGTNIINPTKARRNRRTINLQTRWQINEKTLDEKNRIGRRTKEGGMDRSV